MRKTPNSAIVVCAVMALAACSSNGGDAPAAMNDTPGAMNGDAPGDTEVTEPRPISEADRNQLRLVIANADAISLGGWEDGNLLVWTPLIALDDSVIDPDEVTSDPSLDTVTVRHGVATAGDASTLVGWMDHNFFAIGHDLEDGQGVLGVYSMGVASGSNPVSGGASWRGVMAGIDQDAKLVTGAATAEIPDFANPAVDVAFTKIAVDGGGSRPDMNWSGLDSPASASPGGFTVRFIRKPGGYSTAIKSGELSAQGGNA